MRWGTAVTLSMAAGLGMLVCGCGKPVLRVADASLGDYYTAQEYKKLSEENRQEYCQELAEQDSIYREEIADAREAGERFAGRAQAARAAADSLARLADSLDARVATMRQAPPVETPSHAGNAVVTVRSGDSLWRISAREAIYGDGHRWSELYEANRDRIRDADRIYPGQELVVPR